MFEDDARVGASGGGAGHAPALAVLVREHADRLGVAALRGTDADTGDSGTGLVDLLSELSRLVSAAEACAARASIELDVARRIEEESVGVPASRRGSGVAAEIGLARRESVNRSRTMLGFARVLCTEMPHTMARLAAGDLSPWRALQLVKESACLQREDRIRLDEDLCGDPATLRGMGDRSVIGAAKRWCAREDPASVVARRSQAEADRRVWLRPAPDTMAYLTALVPVTEGVAAYASLLARADSARAAGDERTRGQVMADALVAGVTGRPEGAPPPVLVHLVMTDAALFGGGVEPGHVPGFGPVAAGSAGELVGDAAAAGAAFVRRLYLAPGEGALVAMEARTRKVPKGLSELIRVRDAGTCRVPWCDAPIRHVDHVVGVAEGGTTEESDLQGMCEAHNYAKQAPGWRASPDTARGDGRRHRVTTTTPSGHRYSSTASPLPGTERASPPSGAEGGPAPGPAESPGERRLRDVLSLVA